MGNLRLEELSAKTIVAANGLTLRRGQEQFVTPTSYAIADAYIEPGHLVAPGRHRLEWRNG